jgi:hypothetical protein
LAHWEALRKVLLRVEQASDASSAMDVATNLVQRSQSRYARLDSVGIFVDPQTGPIHLGQWLESIEDFRRITSI